MADTQPSERPAAPTSEEGWSGVEGGGAQRLAADRLLASIVEASDDVIVSKTLEGIIQSLNAAAERVFGYPADEAVGRHISLIIPPERLGEEDDIMKSLRAGVRVDHFETVRVRRDGKRIPVSVTISPIKDDSGRIVGASKIARDISARKEAEAMLRQNEARFRLATRTGNVGVWEWDQATRRVTWTESLSAIFGLDARDSAATLDDFVALAHPADRSRLIEALEVTARDASSCELEVRGVRTDGVEIWLYSTMAAVVVEGDSGARGVIGASLDVTGRHLAEEVLRDADRRKDEFLAILSHELRNPLAPIRAAAQVLLHKTRGDPELGKSAAVIDRQLGHMVRLLEDLLDVSRIARNKLVLRKSPVELQTIIRSAVEASRPSIDAAGHTISVHLPEQSVRLEGDAVRLNQVFSNLLNNSTKYMQRGGRIDVTVAVSGDTARVSIRDEGIGITPDVMPNLFQMFAQSPSSLHRAQGGLGIGLALSRAVAELHGGAITAHSDGAEKGSEFVVELPVAPAAGRAGFGADVAHPEPPRRARKVLIVDDLRDSADSMAELMRLKGHEVHTAYDGAAAIALAAEVQPDVVLLDIGMPGADGFQVCRQIRELPGGGAIFLVAITGWGQADDRARTAQAGFDRHLVKPVDGIAVAEMLDELT
jgi:two-component system, chemotaxis family, CheB/CheR fusion protein